MRDIKFRAWDTEKSEWITENGTTFTSAEISEGPVMLSLGGHLRVLGAHHGPLRDDNNDPEKITGCFGGPSHSEYESTPPSDTKPSYKRQYVLEQFTGLLDKNGTEIYEGDIMKCHSMICQVVYQAPQFVMKKKPHHKTWFAFILAPIEKQFEEIIGNIHQHPELLK